MDLAAIIPRILFLFALKKGVLQSSETIFYIQLILLSVYLLWYFSNTKFLCGICILLLFLFPYFQTKTNLERIIKI